MKHKIIAALVGLSIAGSALVGGAVPAQAATLRVYHYNVLSQCQQAASYYAQRGTIVQWCTAHSYSNGVPKQWRLMFNM
ncbi:hypothetical protein [Arthrobacter antibioticus]|uniref:hypothetical protein n=1 Tax=Arthrobacter sp. H35-MC1 TaxID=3046203 RepID=UPI0024BB1978|nr:hypothetical protein [Arthrobacter sp. H35-MC1]MDJ0315772.1 hypothetical protein [Arthrobacter sp. H35-MC1]